MFKGDAKQVRGKRRQDCLNELRTHLRQQVPSTTSYVLDIVGDPIFTIEPNADDSSIKSIIAFFLLSQSRCVQEESLFKISSHSPLKELVKGVRLINNLSVIK